jgi:hypothetical protein
MTVGINGIVAIDDTPKVSFDDLVSGSIGSQDDDFSIQGLVSVPEELDDDMNSNPLPVLELTTVPATPPTHDLRSCFEPPHNPENMRKRPAHRTITPAPDYCSIYSGIDWRMDVNNNYSSKRHRIYENCTTERHYCRPKHDEDHRHEFIMLLRRMASSARRSLESRSAIVQHKQEFKDCLDPANEEGEFLANETRSKILAMVRKELDHVNRRDTIDSLVMVVVDDSEDESTSSD